MSKSLVRIGGASGYWGDSAMATPQLLGKGSLDYIVYDYLAEITMSIMARAKAKDPSKGYATDFISAVLKPNLSAIAQSGVKIISNAGGLNPIACGEAARALIKELGLSLKVAVISGDDLTSRAADISEDAPKEMFSGASFPNPATIASINAYLGAFPIATALSHGADIIITGRCVDSAVTLGACIHEFGWQATGYDRLASGSLAGHIIECGPQATGGNFTDWREAGDIANIGYPIAEISADGSFNVTKPANTTGLVSVGTVSEQMLYEIVDPQAYLLPDVACDFSEVRIVQSGDNEVKVSGAKGKPPPTHYKTCATYLDGFRTGTIMTFYGFDAAERAEAAAKAGIDRARAMLRRLNAGDFSETSVEMIGAESQFGSFGDGSSAREVAVKIAAKHPTPLEGSVLLKELNGIGLATGPGLSGFRGTPPKPSPVVRLFSYLTPKEDISIKINIDGAEEAFEDAPSPGFDAKSIERPAPPTEPSRSSETVDVPLVSLAWGRSGDKGDKANIGVIARDPVFLPYIWASITEAVVAERLAHFIEGETPEEKVERYYLPGSNAINFLVDNVLGGGGVASIRNDPQGKGYSQLILTAPVSIPSQMAEKL